MAAKALDLNVEDLGFTLKAWYLLLPAGLLIGYLLSYPEYMILHPNALVPDFTLKSFVTLFIVMYVFVAFVEELIFRSVLQSSLEREFGLKKGLFLASILFAVMHAGFGFGEISYAFLTGLLIGFLFQKTKSLPLAVMIHGTINVMVFGLFHVETMANFFSLKDITLPWF
ncbi:MAG: CPBP family intramembrane metalloprotease [Archaeoglobus sp.]|nr:CPBP family intramembrane metalloprotease [Archaeoglobus sp.]